MHLERAICKVIRENGSQPLIQTGWLCSEDGWIITAGHIFVENGVITESGADNFTDKIFVKFPGFNEIQVKLLYAEKQDEEGSDFAILQMMDFSEELTPLQVNINSNYWVGEVSIVGSGEYYPEFATAASGQIESRMVYIKYGRDSYLHISSENAVQSGYSGAPVYSPKANAVIAIQVMASINREENLFDVAEKRTINAMPIDYMIKRYPVLKEHLIIKKRAFSGYDMLEAMKVYKEYRNSHHQNLSMEAIDEMILPMVEREKIGKEREWDLNQPVIDAINSAQDKNCFVWGEEGGSGKTMLLLKLFFNTLKKNTIKEIPIYIELRNLLVKKEYDYEHGVNGNPSRTFTDYLLSELYGCYFSEENPFISKEVLSETIYLEFNNPSCAETKYIFLLDGLNEVTLDKRAEICEDISLWARNSHIRVILTSRYKESMFVEGNNRFTQYGSLEDFLEQDDELENQNKDFLLLTIQKLKSKVISEYLSSNSIQEKMIKKIMNNKELLEIIKIPMYLTIFVKLYHKKISSQNYETDSKLIDICTRGGLLDLFFGEIQNKKRIRSIGDIQKEKLMKSGSENSKKGLIFDTIIPYIAFYMAVRYEYSITERKLIDLLKCFLKNEDSIVKKIDSYRHKDYIGEYRSYCARNNSGYGVSDEIIRIIVEELHIMRRIQIKMDWKIQESVIEEVDIVRYEFLHENLRDYFAAKQLKEDTRCFVGLRISEDLSLAKRNIPKMVLEFYGDICLEEEATPYFDVENREWIQPQVSYIQNVLRFLRGRHDMEAKIMVSNIIAVMQYSRKNDLSGLDLQEIDFTETWLGGIRFSRAYGDTYFSAKFDGATINASNLLRNGHDVTITCVRRGRIDNNIIYSADMSGCIMQWDLKKKTGSEICRLNDSVCDLALSHETDDLIYIACQHVIYQFKVLNHIIKKVYETKSFIVEIKLIKNRILFKTDKNPSEWIELIMDESGQVIQVMGDEHSMAIWLAACSCESKEATFLITGGDSKLQRVRIFHKTESGNWNTKPIQSVSLPFGNRMNWIELSQDETRVLFCVQNYLYEYSIVNGILDTELFRMYERAEFGFASYWYDEAETVNGILYTSGSEIVLLDKNYEEIMRLHSGNGLCRYVSPFLVDADYRFSRQSGIQKDVQEKYHLYMDYEIQEFDADTNICNKIYDIRNRTKLGYCLKDRKVRLFYSNLKSINLQNFQQEDTREENIQFIDYAEMKGMVSFRVQRLGKQIIVYDRYTGENDAFQGYRGLFIQGCSMKDLKGNMKEPKYQEVLRRYGADL